MGLERYCHKNSARHRFGDDKMFKFTKPFERNRLVVRKRIRCQWSLQDNLYLYDCDYDDYIIFLCLCSLPSILCTAFPHLSTTPFTKPFKAKWHCLQCYFLNCLPWLIFLYLSANSYRNIDYYCT